MDQAAATPYNDVISYIIIVLITRVCMVLGVEKFGRKIGRVWPINVSDLLHPNQQNHPYLSDTNPPNLYVF